MWVGLVKVIFSKDGAPFAEETYHIVLTGKEWNEETDRYNAYIRLALKKMNNSTYYNPHFKSFCTTTEFLSEWEEGPYDYLRKDDDGYCTFCGEDDVSTEESPKKDES
jgi:hypothetical protein